MITHELEERISDADVRQVRILLVIASDEYLEDAKSQFPFIGIDVVDYPGWKLRQLDEHTRYLPMSSRRLFQDLHTLVHSSGHSEWIYLEGLDVPLAQIDEGQRTAFWRAMFKSFRKRPRGLLIPFREQAEFLIPVSVRGTAEDASYLVRR